MDEKRDELQAFQRDRNKEVARLYADCRPKFLRWGKEHYKIGAHDLSDIFQNAVVIVLLNIGSGRLVSLVGTLCTYVFGIGKNLIQAFLRKQGRMDMPGDEKMPLSLENDPGAEAQIIEQQENDRLWAAVNALGDPCRSIIVLTYKDGMTSQEIADVLGYSSAEVVRQLRKRCLDKMRKS